MTTQSSRAFVPVLCRLGAHRWRIAMNRLRGTCQCARCGRLKGPGA